MSAAFTLILILLNAGCAIAGFLSGHFWMALINLGVMLLLIQVSSYATD